MEFDPDNFAEEVSEEVQFRNAAVFYSGVAWTVISSFIALARARRWVASRGSPADTWATLARLCRQCLDARSRADADLLAEQAAARLRERRLSRARWLIPWGQACSVLTFFNLALSATNPPRAMSAVQDVAVAAIIVLVSVLWLCWDQIIGHRSLHVSYSVMMMALVVYASPFALRADLLHDNLVVIYLVALSFSMFDLIPALNILWMVILNLTMYTTVTLGKNAGEFDRSKYDVETQLLGYTILFSIFVACLDRSFYHIVRLELEASVSKNELVAATSVLQSVCEVVIELDKDFEIQEHSPPLADLLLLNPHRSLQAEKLTSFLLSDHDRDKFAEQILATPHPDSKKGPSTAFNLRMKDGGGLVLDVEVFSVRFQNRRGQPAFFVGVREFTDTEPLVKSFGRPRGRASGSRRPPEAVEEAPAGQASENAPGGPKAADFDEGGAHQEATVGDLEESGEVSVWIDMRSPGFVVKGFSPAFERYLRNGGTAAQDEPSAEALGRFVDWVKREQREDFLRWAADAYADAYGNLCASSTSSGHVRVMDPIHFRTPHLRRWKLWVSATVTLDLTPAPPGAQVAEESQTARLLLQDVKCVRAVSRKDSGPPMGGRGTPSSPRYSGWLCEGAETSGLLDGNWVTKKNSALTIKGARIVSQGGKRTKLKSEGDGTFSVTMGGKTYWGKLEGDMLAWSDGDVWSRRASSTGMAEASPHRAWRRPEGGDETDSESSGPESIGAFSSGTSEASTARTISSL